MNSVRQKKANVIPQQSKGAGQGVVLFCCVLFCVFQLFTIFTLPRTELPDGQLQISTENKLYFSVEEGLTGNRHTPDLSSPATFKFSPFFFKPIPINYCDKAMLMSVKGVGPDLADNIIATRNRIGRFVKANDLLEVKGIGERRLAKFSPYFCFSTHDE